MAGYHNYSMSNNAITAYGNGEKPISVWTKEDILNVLKREGFQDIDSAKKLTVKEMKSLFLYRTSYHHTGKMYNKTDFYSVNVNVTADQIANVIANRRKEEKPKAVKAFAEWIDWEGTRKHPKAVKRSGYVVIVGNVAHIGNGSTKRTNGKYFTIVNVFDKAPRGTAAIFNEIMKEVKS